MHNSAVIDRDVEVEQNIRKKTRRQPPYNVIIYNDDKHTYAYVMETLKKVFGYQDERGFTLADTIHRTGQAIVWTGTREVAELKVDQVKSAGVDFHAEKPVEWPLRCTCEPAI